MLINAFACTSCEMIIYTQCLNISRVNACYSKVTAYTIWNDHCITKAVSKSQVLIGEYTIKLEKTITVQRHFITHCDGPKRHTVPSKRIARGYYNTTSVLNTLEMTSTDLFYD